MSTRKTSHTKAGRKKRSIREKAANSPDKAFPIVGIGASAGGLEAFTQLLRQLPNDTGMGFVFVQHLDPDHESALPLLLAKATAMPVCEVTHDLRVKPNQVYVIPPNANLVISRGVLKLQPRPKSGVLTPIRRHETPRRKNEKEEKSVRHGPPLWSSAGHTPCFSSATEMRQIKVKKGLAGEVNYRDTAARFLMRFSVDTKFICT